MHPLLFIALVALVGIVLAAFWAGWGSEGRPVLPAERQSRRVDRA